MKKVKFLNQNYLNSQSINAKQYEVRSKKSVDTDSFRTKNELKEFLSNSEVIMVVEKSMFSVFLVFVFFKCINSFP